MDGLEGLGKADAVYPEPLSRHNRSPIVAQQVEKHFEKSKHSCRAKIKGLKQIHIQSDPVLTG